MLDLITLLIAPAAAGATLHHLWGTRPARQRHCGLSVGQIPRRLRRTAMAVRRAGGTP